MRGYVYAMTNPCFAVAPCPDFHTQEVLVKIGMSTKHPTERAKELSGTSVPTPFSVVWSAPVENPKLVEYYLHQTLCFSRCNPSREFFWMRADTIVETLNSRLSNHLEDPDAFTAGFDDLIDTFDLDNF